MRSDDSKLEDMSPAIREMALEHRLYFRVSSWRLEYFASHYNSVLAETKRIYFSGEMPYETAKRFNPVFLMVYTTVNYSGEDEEDPAPLGRIIPLTETGLDIEIPLAESVFESLLSSLQRTADTHDIAIEVVSSRDISEFESGYAPVRERKIEFIPRHEEET